MQTSAASHDTFTSVTLAVTSLLWPLLVALIVIRLLPVLRRVLESRSFTLKAAGVEITAQQATDQLQTQISDLQAKVLELRRSVDAWKTTPSAADQSSVSNTAQVTESAPVLAAQAAPKTVLWVDDKPDNNALEMASLEREGVMVTQARTTSEALALLDTLANHDYAAIITDMGRRENGVRNPQAGLALISEVRKRDSRVPIVVYTAQKSRTARLSEQVQALGGNLVTASSIELLEFLHKVFAAG
jgi:CheY-like chemotaxis protein/outer membrane murein-binding lipoprotein Lpp